MMDRTNFEFAAPMICANCPISPGGTHCVLQWWCSVILWSHGDASTNGNITDDANYLQNAPHSLIPCRPQLTECQATVKIGH